MGSILFAHKCSQCNSGMNEGYCIEAGLSYYCSDECLHKNITPNQWKKMYSDDGDSYWTEWEDEEFANYEELNGELIEI